MFSKLSRYRKLMEIVTTDVKGRRIQSKDLRMLPTVSGNFFHTLEDVDRLDHLAYKYYKQPRKWWRICDANPAFMSPLGLLGKEPIVTTRFPLTFTGANPSWAELLKNLSEKVGVDEARMDGVQRTAEIQIIQGEFRFSVASAFHVDFDNGAISPAFRAAFESNAISLSQDLIVLSERNTWLIVDEDTEQSYAVVPVPNDDPGQRRLDVYHCVLRYAWSVLVTYNQMNVSTEDLADAITSVGFDVGQPESIGRVGKKIIIPPNIVG